MHQLVGTFSNNLDPSDISLFWKFNIFTLHIISNWIIKWSPEYCFQVFNKFPSTVVGPFADIPFPEVTEVIF